MHTKADVRILCFFWLLRSSGRKVSKGVHMVDDKEAILFKLEKFIGLYSLQPMLSVFPEIQQINIIFLILYLHHSHSQIPKSRNF